MALRLADAFGTEPGMWLDLQLYDLWHAASSWHRKRGSQRAGLPIQNPILPRWNVMSAAVTPNAPPYLKAIQTRDYILVVCRNAFSNTG